jgi:HEAT repeat protein
MSQRRNLAIILLALHSFLNGGALALFETVTNSLFLSRLSESVLPYTFIVSAVVLFLLGFGYSKLQEKISPKPLMLTTFGFVTVMMFSSYLGLEYLDSWPLAFCLMTFKTTAYVLVGIEFWAVAGALFNLREGKKLFGILGTGEIVAEIIIGFLVPTLLQWTGQPHNLLLIAGAMLVLSGVLLSYILVSFSKDFASAKTPEHLQSGGRSLRQLFADHFLRTFFLLSVVSFFVEYFLEYVFYNVTHQKYTDEVQLVQFFGTYTGVLGFFQLLGTSLVSGPLISRFGLRLGMLALPMGDILGVSVSLILSFFGFLNPVFFAVAATKILDVALRVGIDGPASRILYQAIPSADRMRVRTIREMMIEPGAAGFSGGLLLLISTLFISGVSNVLLVIFVALVGLAYLGYRMSRDYPQLLAKILDFKKSQEDEIDPNDPSTFSVIKNVIRDNQPDEIIYALQLLENAGHKSLDRIYCDLVTSENPKIACYVLLQIEQRNVKSARSLIETRLRLEANPDIKALLVRAFGALLEEDLDEIYNFLNDRDSRVQDGAIVALLRSGNIEAIIEAGSSLNPLFVSENASDLTRALNILGEVGNPGFYRPIAKLLDHPNLEIRRAAIKAAGKIRSPKLIEGVANLIKQLPLRAAALKSLMEFEGQLVEPVENLLSKGTLPAIESTRLIALLGKTRTEEATEALKRLLQKSDGTQYTQILQSLIVCEYVPDRGEFRMIDRLITHQLKHVSWLLVSRRDLQSEESCKALVMALDHELEKCADRILLLLSFIYPSHSILLARGELSSHDAQKKAHALELIESLLSRKHKKLIIPFLEGRHSDNCYRIFQARFPHNNYSLPNRLLNIIDYQMSILNPWVRACAYYSMGLVPHEDFDKPLLDATKSPVWYIRETALWAASKGRSKVWIEACEFLKSDSAFSVAQLAKFLDDEYMAKGVSSHAAHN